MIEYKVKCEDCKWWGRVSNLKSGNCVNKHYKHDSDYYPIYTYEDMNCPRGEKQEGDHEQE